MLVFRYSLFLLTFIMSCCTFAQSAPPLASQQEALLAQLHDVISPAAPSFWPLATGWWCVIALLIVSLAALFFVWQRQTSRRYRRLALAELEQIRQNTKLSDGQVVQAVLMVLKRTALCAFPTRKSILSTLWGDALLAFFTRSAPSLKEQDSDPRWIEAAYRASDSIDRDALFVFARRWVKEHRLQDAKHV